jgi:amidase
VRYGDGHGEAGVSVAVLNYPVPAPESRRDVRLGYLKMADLIGGLKRNLPSLDLIIFPEYATHGIAPGGHQTDVPVLTTAGEEVAVLASACRKAGVWSVFSVTGGRARSDPYNTIVLVDDRGELVHRYRSIVDGPVQAGPPRVVDGPKGLRMSVTICGDRTAASSECQIRGAELVVRCQARPDGAAVDEISAARSVAWMNTCYVATVNAVGSDGPHVWSGHSAIIGFDGRALGQCGDDEELELQYAELFPSLLRESRLERAQLQWALRGTHRTRRGPGHPPPTSVVRSMTSWPQPSLR